MTFTFEKCHRHKLLQLLLTATYIRMSRHTRIGTMLAKHLKLPSVIRMVDIKHNFKFAAKILCEKILCFLLTTME